MWRRLQYLPRNMNVTLALWACTPFLSACFSRLYLLAIGGEGYIWCQCPARECYFQSLGPLESVLPDVWRKEGKLPLLGILISRWHDHNFIDCHATFLHLIFFTDWTFFLLELGFRCIDFLLSRIRFAPLQQLSWFHATWFMEISSEDVSPQLWLHALHVDICHLAPPARARLLAVPWPRTMHSDMKILHRLPPCLPRLMNNTFIVRRAGVYLTTDRFQPVNAVNEHVIAFGFLFCCLIYVKSLLMYIITNYGLFLFQVCTHFLGL